MAWTDPRTWVDGELVTAALMNTHLRDNLLQIGEPIRKRKTADESVVSSTALQNDDDLFFSIGANEVWYMDCLTFMGIGAGGVAFQWTVPAGASGRLTRAGFDVATFHWSDVTLPGGGTFAGDLPNSPWQWRGYVVNGATPGTVQFQFAQQASNAAATSCLAGSFLHAFGSF